MTREELLELIAEVQRHQSELDDIEVKSARGGTPKRLFEPLSAFSNHSGGGIILLGLDENQSFELVGVGDADRLQRDISDLVSNEMNPPLRSEFTVENIDGKTVIAIEVTELPSDQKPCYYKPASLQKGSYIRVGNTNRQMTDYEIFGYVSARTQATFDEDPIHDATAEDLDGEKIEDYLAQLRRARPQATYLNQPIKEVLKYLRITREVDGIVRPTLAGLLLFGKYPQTVEPQMVITFLQYYGTTEAEKTPRGERFLDNRKFEGPIPEMIERAVNHVLASIRKSSLIEGLYRRDIPEYPEEAVREAVVNAVAHRDYSHFVRGSYIQIRLFADRLEVQSPGGLYGNVTVETLENEQSTRNRILMRLMEDLHLVENRGSGIRTMIAAMGNANLEPPQFMDRRSSFWVTFHSHTLMDSEAIEWLNQFADRPLNDHQRLALVYFRHHQQMTNSDYQRLNHVDSVTANRELHSLVQLKLVDQHGTRRWAYYTLKIPIEVKVVVPPQTDEEKILAHVREHRSIKRSECQQLLGVSGIQARYLLQKMRKRGLLRLDRRGRGARYILP